MNADPEWVWICLMLVFFFFLNDTNLPHYISFLRNNENDTLLYHIDVDVTQNVRRLEQINC